MGRLKQILFRVFLLFERAGVHVLPRHYYSPVAERRWLRDNPGLWQRRYDLGWNLDEQLAWLDETCSGYLGEVSGFSFLDRVRDLGLAFRYGEVEGQVLHCAVRKLAPRLIVEVGSGSSTVISSDAVALNEAENRPGARIIAIDPFAPPELVSLRNVEVQTTPAQAIPFQVFGELNRGDILFLDSTHVLRTGSELHRLYLDIMPKLKPGVIVHIHDIYLPWMYSPRVMEEFWDWQETALLAALLADNEHLRVLCCQSALHDARSGQMKAILPDYEPRPLEMGLDARGQGHFPASTWLLTR